MEKKQSRWIWGAMVAVYIAASILSYIYVPSIRDMINKIVTTFTVGDLGAVGGFVASYGSCTVVISFGLMVPQSVMASPLTFLIIFASANLFGWWQGTILSWSSAMAGAAPCFYITRILGEDTTGKLTNKAGLKQTDTLFDKYGRNTILIRRLLSFVPFNVVSYGAGPTSMPSLSLFTATRIGQFSATVVYFYVGEMLTGGARFLITGLLILFALSAFTAMIRKIYMKKQDKTRRKG